MKNFLQGTFKKQVGATLLTQLLSLVFSVITSIVIARWLGPEGKGIVTMSLLVPGMMVIFLNAGIGTANIYFAGTKRLDVSGLEANSISFALIGTALGGVILAGLFASGWSKSLIPEVPQGLILLATLGLPLGLICHYFSNILQGLHRFNRVNTVNLFQGLATLLFTLLLVVWFKLSTVGAVLAYLIPSLLSLFILALQLKEMGGAFISKWNPVIMRSTLSFGLKGYVGNIFQFLNYRIDVLLVNYFLGPVNVGIYSVSVVLAELLWQLPSAIQFVIIPKAASTDLSYLNRFTPRLLRITLLLTCCGSICLAVVGKYIITLVYGVRFQSSYYPLLILLPGVVALSGAKVLASELIGRGYPHYNSLSSGITAIMSVALNLWLIPKAGILGAALTSSIAYIFHFILTIKWHSRVSGLGIYHYARH